MWSDTLNPGGEVRGCCVGCMLGMPEISPFVFIAASNQLHEISRTIFCVKLSINNHIIRLVHKNILYEHV